MQPLHFMRGAIALIALLALIGLQGVFSSRALATDVRVVGLFPTRAVISIDGGAPRTLAIGSVTPEGIRLLAIESDAATLEVDGKRRTLKIGQYVGSNKPGGPDKVVLAAGSGGHFIAPGQINGGAVRFLVDTGATSIAISADDARRFGINYFDAPRGQVQTANGSRSAWSVKLDTVSIGAITLNGVDALVLDGGLGMPLLGMSFLSRTNMHREGDTLTLTKRF